MLKIAATVAVVTALAALGAAIWARNISVPAARYHEAFALPPEDLQTTGGFVAVRGTDDSGFARLVDVIAASPRTTKLGGRVEDGHVSFVTRTRVMGFPDVTNVIRTDDGLAIRGHLVVGKGDMGVNRRRVEGWLVEAGLS